MCQRFQKYLLHRILRQLFILQVFHGHTQQQQRVSLQQQTQPMVIAAAAVMQQQIFIALVVMLTELVQVSIVWLL